MVESVELIVIFVPVALGVRQPSAARVAVRACRLHQEAAEVFRSPPYSPTIWVEVRVQEPIVGEEDLSLRATATVTIEPRVFHRFDHEMTIALYESER